MLSWNQHLFFALNAAERPGPVALQLAGFVAGLPVIAAPLLLAGLWIWGPPARRPALLAVLAGLIAGQGLNMLAGAAWFEPRPFMAGLGQTWIEHVADNGFPSDHATLGWSLGLGVALTGAARWWAAAICLMTVLTGWARVYLGVHFPIDILASFAVGLLAAAIARAVFLPVARAVAPPIERLYEAVLARLPPGWPVPRRTGGRSVR